MIFIQDETGPYHFKSLFFKQKPRVIVFNNDNKMKNTLSFVYYFDRATTTAWNS